RYFIMQRARRRRCRREPTIARLDKLMTRTTTAARAALLLTILALGCGRVRGDAGDVDSPSVTPAAATAPGMNHPSFLYARVTTVDGDTYEGRIRFGGNQEAFWADYFNGFKDGNPWVRQAPEGAVPGVRRPIRVLGLEFRPPWS